MAFERPTLLELVTRIEQDFISRLELSGALLRRSLARVFSRVLAGAVHMLYGRQEFLARQLFPDISEDEFLRRQASLYGLVPQPATYASGNVTMTGSEEQTVNEGTVLRRSDGVEYITTAEGTISGGEMSVPAVAVLAGANGNIDAGTALSFESPVAEIDVVAFVGVAGLTGGADQESISVLRTRLLARLRNSPQGGAEGDYLVWALSVAGVTRAWVYPREQGAGSVVVRFVRDNDVSIIPSAGEVEDVQDYIDTVRPVTAAVTVMAPVAKTWNFTLAVEPDTTAVRTAVQAELVDLFRSEGVPGVTLPLSRVRTAIGIAEGLTDYTLTTPSADLTHAGGELPVMGTITWV